MSSDNFCKKCGSVLIPVGNYSKCPKCGREESAKNIKTEEKIPVKPKVGKGAVDDENVFASYEHKCEKCAYGKAEVVDQGIKYSDEESSVLLRSGKCGWSEQISKKTS